MNTLIKENQVIDNFSELLSVFYSGIKKAKALGVEFEKIPVYQDNYTAVEFFFPKWYARFFDTIPKNK